MSHETKEIKAMSFMEAKAALKVLAQGKYHAIEFGLSEHEDGKFRPSCKVFISGLTWSEGHATWEAALANMEGIIAANAKPAVVGAIAPGAPVEVAA